jgi:type IV secretory pathway TrbF-like protein
MTAQDTGFLGARQYWDDRVKMFADSARVWRSVAVGALAVSALAIVTLGYLFAQSRHRVIPYVIGLDEITGRTAFAGLATEKRVDDKLLAAVLYDWVEKWRMVSSDSAAQVQAIKDTVYTHIAEGSPARAEIDEWYRAAPPQERVKGGVSVTVEVRNVLKTGEHNYEADWVERTWQSGSMKSETKWKGSFTVAISPPADEKLAYVNPLGVYITSASWSRVVE